MRMLAEGRRCPVDSLGDDLAMEILSRLPVRSLCRFKCVSKTWRNLITHPDHRRRLPQALAGFFHGNLDRQSVVFVNLSAEKWSTSLAFLPAEYHKGTMITFLDCCNDLLLLLCSSIDDDPRYVVCNPATEKWVALPASTSAGGSMSWARLGFDPAVSPHFHVVEFAGDMTMALEVYSSKTGEWARQVKGLSGVHDAYMVSFSRLHESSPAFLDGCMHFLNSTAVALIDMESKTWRETPFLDAVAVTGGVMLLSGSLHVSQDRLHYADYHMDKHDRFQFVVYVLNKGDGCGEPGWALKHIVETEHLFGVLCFIEMKIHIRVVMHPQCNLVFFIDDRDNVLTSYDMDRRRVQVVRKLGPDSQLPYLPYVPLYSEFGHRSST